ncbi:type IV secretory system conjugative DNA transfer family protein [Vibrio crassostreae]|uniref:type IV secretory system conjugative DNA transfer family protein n=1 Tax=Vibrio crassostreae TaxID=246167 RepID=UPI001B30A38B|nr:hypothetical protein [Vibrio crassostreae]
MSAKNWHGVSDDSLRNNKDVRSTTKKISDGFTHKKASLLPIGAMAASFIPSLQHHADTLMLSAIPLSYFCTFPKIKVPFEKPFYDTKNEKDGFFFFGNELSTNKEIWFTDSESRRHILIMGTTGAGKSESLIGIVANSIAQNSAFTYVDGKADTGLFSKIFSLCRRFGREDDLLVINYMVGSLKADVKRDKKLSNTLNPFANNTAEALSELITSLLPSGGSSDGIWKDRASVFMSALIKSLVSLRDAGHILLDVNIIRQHFTLEKIVQLSKDTRIKESDREGLINYVLNLPGYQEDKGDDQEPTVYEQNGYVVMQFQPCFGMLSDTYGHVMKTQLADVDFKDVVLQRRILCVLLPALEKSPSNLSNLGKVIISSIKGMMASSLGAELEGLTEYTLDAKPTNGRTYQCVFDEYGYYSVEGAAVMPAQARGIGFSLVFAGQDYQAFKKGSPEEAASIKANCAIKICMTLEDPTETAEIFTKGAGQGLKAVEGGVEKEVGAFGTRLISSKNITFEKVQRVDERDLKDQMPGEFHIINMDNLCRGRSFYANPKQLKELRVNSFVKVKPPEFEEVERVRNSMFTLKKKFDGFDARQKQKIDKAWIRNADQDSLDLSKGINFRGGSGLKQATTAIALRKHKVDVVNNALVLKVKELESYINSKELSGDELFTDEIAFQPDVENGSAPIAEDVQALSPKDILAKRIEDNEVKIIDTIDLDKNPITAIRTELDDIQESVSDLSKAILKRWRDRGLLNVSSVVLDEAAQDEVACITAQDALLETVSNQAELEVENIEQESAEAVSAIDELDELMDLEDFEDLI